MSIDFRTETVIDVKHEAPKHVGSSRKGRPVHYSFFISAITKGINRLKLEAVRVGSRWLTSVEAIQRWAERQTPGMASPATDRSGSDHRRTVEQAELALKERGL